MFFFVICNWNMYVMSKFIVMECGVKYCDVDKMVFILVKNVVIECEVLLCKLEWMKIKFLVDFICIQGIKVVMCKNGLYFVCEEVFCFNLVECFNHGIVMFMIFGVICICCCLFCDVVYGCLVVFDVNELVKLVQIIVDMVLCYVVIIFVDCDDLCDGGVQYFVDCIIVIWEKSL